MFTWTFVINLLQILKVWHLCVARGTGDCSCLVKFPHTNTGNSDPMQQKMSKIVKLVKICLSTILSDADTRADCADEKGEGDKKHSRAPNFHTPKPQQKIPVKPLSLFWGVNNIESNRGRNTYCCSKVKHDWEIFEGLIKKRATKEEILIAV